MEKKKVILLHGFSDKELNEVIDNYLKNKLPKTAFATTTKTNLNKKLKEVIKDVQEESNLNK